MLKYSKQNFAKQKKPTSGWVQKFKQRHNLKSRVVERLEVQRSDFGTTGTLSHWFDEIFVKSLPGKLDPKLFFNFDELMIGGGRRFQVVVRSESKRAIRADISKNEHITVGMLISASGESWVPYMILNRKTLPRELQQLVMDKQIFIGGQNSGWMTRDTFFDWAIQFVNHVQRVRQEFHLEDYYAVLVLDAHTSREHFETLQLLRENNIIVITFPAHTSHICQPIDRSIAFPFKQELMKLYRKYQKISFSFTDSGNLTEKEKIRFAISLAVIDACKRACTIVNIQNGFRVCGLYPPCKETLLNNPRIRKVETNMEMEIQQKFPNQIRISGKCLTDESLMEQIKEKEEKKVNKRGIEESTSRKSSNQSSNRKKTKRDETKIEQIPPSNTLPFILPNIPITFHPTPSQPVILPMAKNSNIQQKSIPTHQNKILNEKK